MFVHMETRRASLERHRCESPTGQGRRTSSSMPRWLRFLSIGVMILFVLPEEVKGTVYMVNQCGRTIHSSGDMIFSQGGLYYPPNANCTVTIATPSGDGHVFLQLHDSDLKSDVNCTNDYLEIGNIRAKDKDGNGVNFRRICGATTPLEVMSEGPSLRLRLVTDGMGSGRGWSGVFTQVLPADINLCLGYERFQCSNGRCIPSVLRCDSVNHCGDDSDEVHGCQDDLPYYLGDRIVEQREAVYIGLALGFTAIFAIYFATVCTRDTCKQIRRKVKNFINRQPEDDSFKGSVEELIEAELRQALMANSLYDRRVSQPYDTTLNTITGGELARQLKLELRKIQENGGGGNGFSQAGRQASAQRSVNYSYDKINSTSELIHLIDREHNNNHPTEGVDNDGGRFPENPYRSEHRVSFDSIPSVVVSEDGNDGTKAVLYDPGEELPKVVLRNSSKGLYQKRGSRSSISSIPEEQFSQKTPGGSSAPSRFKVTTVPDDKVPSTSEAASKVSPDRARGSSRFQVTQVPEDGSPSKSASSPTSDRNRSESLSRFQVTPVPEDKCHHNSKQADTVIPTKSAPPSKPRFSVSKVPDDEVQIHQNVQRSVSMPASSRFSVTVVDENEQKQEDASPNSTVTDTSAADLPKYRYLRVPSGRKVSSRTASSVPKKASSRFSVKPVQETPLDIQSDSKKGHVENKTPDDAGTESQSEKNSQGSAAATPSRFKVERVAEEQAPEAPKKLVSILKKFEILPDGTRSYTKQSLSRSRRASEGTSLDSPEEESLPSSAVTVHGYTSVKFWDEKHGRYSYVSHL